MGIFQISILQKDTGISEILQDWQKYFFPETTLYVKRFKDFLVNGLEIDEFYITSMQSNYLSDLQIS